MTVVLFSSSVHLRRVLYTLQQNSITIGPMSVFLISCSLLVVWDSILESWHIIHVGLWWRLCVQGPKDFLKTLIKSLSLPCVWWSLPGLPPALRYIIDIHLLISVPLFMIFFFIVFKLPFPPLFMISWSFWQTNKQGEEWRSSRWICEYG